jgi:hypothetical protein
MITQPSSRATLGEGDEVVPWVRWERSSFCPAVQLMYQGPIYRILHGQLKEAALQPVGEACRDMMTRVSPDGDYQVSLYRTRCGYTLSYP